MKLSRKKPKDEPVFGIQLRQVGVVKSPLKAPSPVADSGDLEWQSREPKATESREVISELVIDSDLAGILDSAPAFENMNALNTALILCKHEFYHAGQIAVMRRILGRERTFG